MEQSRAEQVKVENGDERKMGFAGSDDVNG